MAKKNVKTYYPNRLLGRGAYKQVYSVTSDLKNIVSDDEDVLSDAERESLSVQIEDKASDNVVIIMPKEYLVSSKEAEEFEEEMELQQEFALKGLAPRVLSINKPKVGIDYYPYAATYRCKFNLCEYEYSSIDTQLKKLFDGVANAGYIYTDIKQDNMCEFNVLHKKKVKSKHFVFVDFDKSFVYNYKGFNPAKPSTSTTWKQYFTIEEIVSDMMEFMFILIELHRCELRLDCKFCDNTKNMTVRIYDLFDKYKGGKGTHNIVKLLHFYGVDYPFLSPLEMTNYYLQNEYTGEKTHYEMLSKSFLQLLLVWYSLPGKQSNTNTKSKTKSKT